MTEYNTFKIVIIGGGKSRCDTYAAITKHKVDAYVRAGNNADSPKSFAEAIVNSRSVANVSCLLGVIRGQTKDPIEPIPKIRSLHQFMFYDNAILARQVPGVGEGILLDMSGKEMKVDTEFDHEVVNANDMENNLPKRRTSKPFHQSGPKLEPVYNYEEEKTETVEATSSGTLYTCTKNPNCTLKYIRAVNFHKHLEAEDACKIRIVHPTHRDLFISLNVKDNGLPNCKNLLATEEGKQMIRAMQAPPEVKLDENLPLENTDLTRKDVPLIEQFPMGHGLPLARKVTRHSAEVHLFVYELYKQGLQPGQQNVKASTAVKLMEEAKNADGSLRFPDPRKRLDERQVKSKKKTIKE